MQFEEVTQQTHVRSYTRQCASVTRLTQSSGMRRVCTSPLACWKINAVEQCSLVLNNVWAGYSIGLVVRKRKEESGLLHTFYIDRSRWKVKGQYSTCTQGILMWPAKLSDALHNSPLHFIKVYGSFGSDRTTIYYNIAYTYHISCHNLLYFCKKNHVELLIFYLNTALSVSNHQHSLHLENIQTPIPSGGELYWFLQVDAAV